MCFRRKRIDPGSTATIWFWTFNRMEWTDSEKSKVNFIFISKNVCRLLSVHKNAHFTESKSNDKCNFRKTNRKQTIIHITIIFNKESVLKYFQRYSFHHYSKFKIQTHDENIVRPNKEYNVQYTLQCNNNGAHFICNV